MLLDPHASQAYEMPWCALTEIGGNAMYENCSIPTFELCVQEVIAGNRGFCIPNPRWQAPRRPVTPQQAEDIAGQAVAVCGPTPERRTVFFS